jgi:diadenosine tetraphosphate (Ap4A) HIT family hydrolase
VADAFPIAAGHALVIPRRHVASFFELTEEEVIAVHELLRRMKVRLHETLKLDGYNIGVNVGTASGG